MKLVGFEALLLETITFTLAALCVPTLTIKARGWSRFLFFSDFEFS